jgi:hypothetical protein
MALCLQVIKTGALLICVTNFNVTFNAIFKTTFDTIFDIIFDTISNIISNTNQDHRRCMASAIAWGGISFVHWVRRRLLIKVIKLNKAIKANYMQPTYR